MNGVKCSQSRTRMKKNIWTHIRKRVEKRQRNKEKERKKKTKGGREEEREGDR